MSFFVSPLFPFFLLSGLLVCMFNVLGSAMQRVVYAVEENVLACCVRSAVEKKSYHGCPKVPRFLKLFLSLCLSLISVQTLLRSYVIAVPGSEDNLSLLILDASVFLILSRQLSLSKTVLPNASAIAPIVSTMSSVIAPLASPPPPSPPKIPLSPSTRPPFPRHNQLRTVLFRPR